MSSDTQNKNTFGCFPLSSELKEWGTSNWYTSDYIF